MWCTDCQQDVPAVSRSMHEPLVCPRCQSQLAAAPSDAGIALDTFDRARADAAESLQRPHDWFEQEETRQRVRKIDQVLHSPSDFSGASQLTPGRQHVWPESPVPPANVPHQTRTTRIGAKSKTLGRPTKGSWLLSLLLAGGVLGFCAGAGLLCWSIAFDLPQLWQQGMTLTISAEGLLITSLTWMAARLWRNGRSVNQQLHGVDRQLAEMQQITGTLAGSQTASSQHFYHHFSQAASPHMLVANLRGQMDQLASRIGR